MTKKSLVKSVSTVSSGTAFSRILGLVREQVMAYYFGASHATDAFVTAFRIPNLLRDMFAEGALSSAFVPVFKEKIVNESQQEAFNLANRVITALFLVVGVIVLLGIIGTPAIIYISAKGFTADPDKFDLTVNLTRIMFVYLLLVSLSAVVMGILNSFGKFAIPSIAPAMFNFGMILSVVMLYEYLELPIYSLAIGVLIGGVGQLVVQIPYLLKLGYSYKPLFDLLDSSIKKVYRLFIPMVVGLSASRLNIILNTLIASFLIEGAISYLSYSYRLMHFPLGVFAVAIGTVALPKASEIAARGDFDELGQNFKDTIILNLLLLIPSATALAFFAEEIVSVIFQHGSFGEYDVTQTALALRHYSYGLIGFGAVRVTAPFYYALGNAKLPTRISLITIFLNILLYYPMISVLKFAGLAAATSIAGLTNFILLLLFLKKVGIKTEYWSLILIVVRLLLASLIAFYSAIMIPIDFDFISFELLNDIFSLFIKLLAGSILFAILCFLFGVKDIQELFSLFRGYRRK